MSSAPDRTFEPLLEQLPIAVALFDRELRCVWINRTAAELAGGAEPEARGRPLHEVFTTFTDRGLPLLASVAVESGVGFAGIPLDSRGSAIERWTASGLLMGELLGIVLVPADERERTESDALFRAVFDRAPIGLMVLDWSGTGVRANTAMQQMLGYSEEELGRIGIQAVTHPEDFASDRERFQRVMAGEINRYSLLKRYIKKDGSILWARLIVSVARDAHGRPELVISSIEDVTEHKLAHDERERLLRELEQALHSRDVFLSIASHELRTPLTALGLSLEALEQKAGRSRELTVALGQVERLGMLVDRLLEASRDSGPVMRRDPLDLSALARAVVEQMRGAAERELCSLALDAPAPVHVIGDAPQLGRVLGHLLTNAIKFGAGSPITVGVSSSEDLARLCVKDRGIGIDPVDHGRIFERFGRAVSEMRYGGFGLGLALCREIVHAHGGSITVESTLGRGATFTVALPLAT
jgi:PAS domain S-box-containing protein